MPKVVDHEKMCYITVMEKNACVCHKEIEHGSFLFE